MIAAEDGPPTGEPAGGDLLLALAGFLSVASFTASALAAIGYFEGTTALFAGLLLALVLPGGPTRPARLTAILVGVATLLVFLALRWPTYPHYEGGQDQGLYFNWARVLDRENENRLCDSLVEHLTEEQRELYEEGGGFAVPGITPSGEPNCYRLALYPLWPTWLAMTSELLGPDYRGLASIFFSLVLVAGAVRLTSILAQGDPRSACWALGLLAVNPGLVFATRYPISEMMAASLIVLALALLATAWSRARRGIGYHPHLVASACVYACYVMTRASSILLLAFFAGLALAIQTFVHRQSMRRPFLRLLASYGLLSLASLGLYSGTLETAFVDKLTRVPTSTWLVLGSATAAWTLAFTAAASLRRHPRLRRLRRSAAHQHRWILLAFVASAVWSQVAVVSQGLLSGAHRLIYEVPGGFEGLTRTLLFRWLVYLTPLGFLALMVVTWNAERRRSLLIVGALGSVVFSLGALGQGWSFYSFYYDRYLFSELLPLSLVALASASSRHWQRGLVATRVVSSVLILVALVGLLSSLRLSMHPEGSPADVFQTVEDLASELEADAPLILLETDSIPHHEALITGLRLDRGLPVLPLTGDVAALDPALSKLLASRSDLLLVSGRSELEGLSFDKIAEVGRRRSFFRDRSRHMLDLLLADDPRIQRQDLDRVPDRMQFWLPPTGHTELSQILSIYRPGDGASGFGAGITLVEAETLPTTVPGPRLHDRREPRENGGNGIGRLAWSEDDSYEAVVYGPYLPVIEGCYRAMYWIRAHPGGVSPAGSAELRIDVASGRGERVYAAGEIAVTSDGYTRYQALELPLRIPEPVADLELRLWLRRGAIWVDRIGLVPEPCDDDPAT
ncbi:MAG: hypothetical protein MI919_24895 [Holophagales bacterium]|nr:hypothetical protein [Holophagales bacterium]